MSTSRSIGVLFLLASLLTIAPCFGQQDQSERLIRKHDHDGDGKLSRAELPPNAQRLFERVDADHDGFITLEEDRDFRQKRGQGKPRGEMDRPAPPAPDHANVKYGPHERNVFDLWLARSHEPTPLVIYYHGGGFRGGDKRTLDLLLLRKLLESGVSVAAANYRLSNVAPFPAQMHDAARCLQYIRHNAFKYGIDPKRAAATGGSAGAGISLWLAFHDDLADPESEDPVARESTRISGAVVYAAQSSYDPRSIKKLFATDQVDGALIPFYGMTGAQDVDDPKFHLLFEEASPINHATADDPPVMLFYPQPNLPLPPNSSGKQHIHHPKFGFVLKEKLDSLGVECVLKLKEDYGPGADRSSPVDDYVTFFLDKLGVKTAQSARPSREVRLPTSAATLTLISSLPAAEHGADIRNRPDFVSSNVSSEDGSVGLQLGEEPLWIVEGNLPETTVLEPELSPFGFHPAAALGGNYSYAGDIRVAWDRGGLYLMWVIAQPDAGEERYVWHQYDKYFEELPPGMLPVKNITVAHDGMVRVPGRPERRGRTNRRPIDVSQHLEGTTYRPKAPGAYSRWVKAAVERYDGDGKDDMPGLEAPLKHWQVDNEPPRGREGYVDLVRITSQAIKAADPEAKVLVGGLIMPYAENIQRYEELSSPILRELGGKWIDIVDLHWFGFAGEWEQVPQALARVRKDLHECGFEDIPIWILEMGTYSGRPKGRGRGRLPEQTERGQASEMIKRHVTALGEGVGKIFWAWGMMEGFGDPSDNDFFDNTGFVYDGIGPSDPGGGTRKIIYWSYQQMTDLLQYWDGSSPEKVDAGKGAVAYRFRFSEKEQRGIMIAWCAD